MRCLQHVCLTIAVALVFHTDLDSPFGPTFGLEDPTAYQLFREDIEARKVHFDFLLVSTFIVCIPGCASSAWPATPPRCLTRDNACALSALAIAVVTKLALVGRVLR